MDKRLRKEPKPDVSRYVMIKPVLECYDKYFWLTFSKLGENNCGKRPWCAVPTAIDASMHIHVSFLVAVQVLAMQCIHIYFWISCAKCSGSHTKVKKVPPWDRMVLLDTMGTFEKHKDMIYARVRAQILFRTDTCSAHLYEKPMSTSHHTHTSLLCIHSYSYAYNIYSVLPASEFLQCLPPVAFSTSLSFFSSP